MLAAGLAAAALTACGGSARHPLGSGHENGQLALAECMRAHGVSNFPDPTTGPGGGEGFAISSALGSSTVTVDGTSFAGPVFTSAEKTCKLFGGGTAPPPVSEKQKEQLVAFARCMRDHGFPDWADPTFPPGGGVQPGGPPGGADRNSPRVMHAAQTCNRIAGL